jgi:hypothetical protein
VSEVVSQKKHIVHSDLGNVQITTNTIREYDVEDLVRQKAHSQMLRVRFVNLGKEIDVNIPKPPRTIGSVYLRNDDELES